MRNLDHSIVPVDAVFRNAVLFEHQRFMGSAFDPIAVAHPDKLAGDRRYAVMKPVLGQRSLSIGGKICVIIARIQTWNA